jgi:DNA-binding MarR family transcriptional regulator
MNPSIIEELNTDLRAITQAVEIYSHATFRHTGITGPQLVVLAVLERQVKANAVDLARRVHLSMATLSGIIARLEQRGLIERARSDQDRRKADIRLTEAGRHFLESSPPLLEPNFIKAFEALPGWQQQMILSSLKHLVALLTAGNGKRSAPLSAAPPAPSDVTLD